MRIVRLDLEAFGTLSGRSVAFDPRPGTISIVYGPNEAGKSTSLRAIHALLYGIPSSSPDGHSTPGGEIRVGGMVESSAGDRLALRRRRKGRTVSLVDAEDRPLDEEAFARAFSLPDAETFRTLHGLDHVSLREGAALVLDARGRVGELLFDAARMGPSVGRVLRDLDAEAESLFAPLARKRPLNEAIRAFAEHDRRTRLEGLDVDAYERQLGAIAQAHAEAVALEAERKRLVAELDRLQSLRARVPLAKEKRRIALARAGLSRGASLPLAAFEERRRAVQDIQEGASMLSLLEAERARIAQTIDALPPPDPIVERADEVEKLRSAAAVFAAQAEDGAIDAKLRTLEARLAGASAAAPEVQATVLVRLLGSASAAVAEAARVARAETEVARVEAQIGEARRGLGTELGLLDAVAIPSAAVFETQRRALVARAADVRAARSRRAEIGAADPVRGTAWGTAVDEALHARRDLVDAMGTLAASLAQTSFAGEAADVLSRVNALGGAIDALVAAHGDEGDVLRKSAARAEEALAHALGAFSEEAARAGFGGVPFDDVEPRLERVSRGIERLDALLLEHAARVAALETARSTARVVEDELRASALVAGLASGGDLESLRRRIEEAIGVRALVDERASLQARAAAASAARAHLEAALAALGIPAFASPAVAATEALARFARARKDRDARAAAEATRTLCADRIARQSERVAAGRAKLEAMAAEAGVRVEELDLAEAKARAIDALASDEREVDEKLALVSTSPLGTADIEALDRLDLDAVEADIEDVQQRIADVAQRRDVALRDVGGKEAGLRAFEEEETGATTAALLAEAELVRIRELSRRYATLRLARALLAEEVERYRKENEGPVLGRARELFEKLTLGRFGALVVDALAGPVPELRCRAGNELLDVAALSEGTRDQLYLALRIATLEHVARTRGPLPLVLDDVLVHFDEARAEIALRVLAEAARAFQVILFTHQRRIVEIAEGALPEGARDTHTL